MNYRDDNKEQLSEKKKKTETCKITVADLLGGKNTRAILEYCGLEGAGVTQSV
jgi:RecA/RadA recombinase